MSSAAAGGAGAGRGQAVRQAAPRTARSAGCRPRPGWAAPPLQRAAAEPDRCPGEPVRQRSLIGADRGLKPAARVVYTDNDPMVLAHSRALKTGAGTAVIQADLREPGAVLGHPDTLRLIDFGQPVAVLFAAVLHFIADADDPHHLVSEFLAAAPGSYLVVSHATADPSPAAAAGVTAVYAATSNPPHRAAGRRFCAFSAASIWSSPAWCPSRNGGPMNRTG